MSPTNHDHNHEDPKEVAKGMEDRYERSDARFSSLMFYTFFIILMVIATLVAVMFYERWGQNFVAQMNSTGQPVLEEARKRAVPPPEPRLQMSPAGDMAEYRKSVNERLFNYGWVQKEAGVVHVPIEKAIEVALANSATVFPTKVNTQAFDSGTSTAQDSSSGATYRNKMR